MLVLEGFCFAKAAAVSSSFRRCFLSLFSLYKVSWIPLIQVVTVLVSFMFFHGSYGLSKFIASSSNWRWVLSQTGIWEDILYKFSYRSAACVRLFVPYRTKQCRTKLSWDKIFRWTKFSSRSENFITFVKQKILCDKKFCPFLIFLISFKHQLVLIYSVKINVIKKALYPEQIYCPISYQK